MQSNDRKEKMTSIGKAAVSNNVADHKELSNEDLAMIAGSSARFQKMNCPPPISPISSGWK